MTGVGDQGHKAYNFFFHSYQPSISFAILSPLTHVQACNSPFHHLRISLCKNHSNRLKNLLLKLPHVHSNNIQECPFELHRYPISTLYFIVNNIPWILASYADIAIKDVVRWLLGWFMMMSFSLTPEKKHWTLTLVFVLSTANSPKLSPCLYKGCKYKEISCRLYTSSVKMRFWWLYGGLIPKERAIAFASLRTEKPCAYRRAWWWRNFQTCHSCTFYHACS